VGVLQHPSIMNDLIYLGISIAFFIISGLYANGCETL
jgi:hypothetical protein